MEGSCRCGDGDESIINRNPFFRTVSGPGQAQSLSLWAGPNPSDRARMTISQLYLKRQSQGDRINVE